MEPALLLLTLRRLRDAVAAWRLATPTLATWQRQQFPIRRQLDTRNVLVTGATGFIGRSVCRRLIEQGHRVIVLTRDRLRAGDLFGPYCDIVESLEEIRSTRRIDAVINLALESATESINASALVIWYPLVLNAHSRSRSWLRDQTSACRNPRWIPRASTGKSFSPTARWAPSGC